MSLDWRVVPMKSWPGELTKERKSSRFSHSVMRGTPTWEGGSGRYKSRQSGVDWVGTTKLMERELVQLEATNVVLQMQVAQRDIRNDGWIRSDARPAHPGVILTFSSRTLGPLSYPCDTYDDWQANVRAIALSLEALRSVDRHGVTKRGEQYQGFAQLPPAGGATVKFTAHEAAALLVEIEGMGGEPEDLLQHPLAVKLTYRNAAKKAHPDAGGSAETMQRVNAAKIALDKHHEGRTR